MTYTAQSEDDDVAKKFIDSIESEIKKIYQQFKFPKKMICSQKDLDDFHAATTCHICGEKGFVDENNHERSKVRDHCHLSGKMRGTAHNKCNLEYRVPKFFPVVMYKLSGYDSHLFIKKLTGDVSCIPSNEEKYISFSKISL